MQRGEEVRDWRADMAEDAKIWRAGAGMRREGEKSGGELEAGAFDPL